MNKKVTKSNKKTTKEKPLKVNAPFKDLMEVVANYKKKPKKKM